MLFCLLFPRYRRCLVDRVWSSRAKASGFVLRGREGDNVLCNSSSQYRLSPALSPASVPRFCPFPLSPSGLFRAAGCTTPWSSRIFLLSGASRCRGSCVTKIRSAFALALLIFSRKRESLKDLHSGGAVRCDCSSWRVMRIQLIRISWCTDWPHPSASSLHVILHLYLPWLSS